MSAVLPKSLLAETSDVIKDELVRLRYALRHDFEDQDALAVSAIKEEVADGYNEVVVLKNTPVTGHTMIARTPWSTEVLEFNDASVDQLSIAEMANMVDHFLSQVAA